MKNPLVVQRCLPVGRSPLRKRGYSLCVGDKGSGCVNGNGTDEAAGAVGVGRHKLSFGDGTFGDFHGGAEARHADRLYFGAVLL